MVKIDLGCGNKKTEGYIGVDVIGYDGVDHCCDAEQYLQTCKDSTVDEIKATHLLEFLKQHRRLSLLEEAHRVLKKGASLIITVPDWSHSTAYGHPDIQWPPFSSSYFYYLNKTWRSNNNAMLSYDNIDFDVSISSNIHPNDSWMIGRTDEFKSIAIQRNINTGYELVITLTKV